MNELIVIPATLAMSATSTMPGMPVLLAGAWWPTVSLGIFLTLFVGIVAYVFIVPKSVWNKDAQIPLDDSPTLSRGKERNRG